MKALLFDMHGVIVDSPNSVWKTHNELLAPYGVHVPDADVHRYLGHSLREQIRLFNEQFHLDLGEAYFNDFRAGMDACFARNEPHSPVQLPVIMCHYKTVGVKIAVVTMSMRDDAQRIIERAGIAQLLDAVVTSEDLPEHRAEALYTIAAQKLGVQLSDCVLVDDTNKNLLEAKRLGMYAVGMANRFERSLNGDVVIHSIDELTQVIKK